MSHCPTTVVLVALAHVALASVPALGQSHGDIRLPSDQSAAARRIALRLADGNVSKQVFTADYAARLCYRAAVSNPSNAGGARDRNRLTQRQRDQLVECLAESGYRLRGG